MKCVPVFLSSACERKAWLACRLHNKHLEDLVHAFNVESPLLVIACKNTLVKYIGRNITARICVQNTHW